jgi:hypothetical protein
VIERRAQVARGCNTVSKKNEGNGPVAVETACSSSMGVMMEEAGRWERQPDLVGGRDGKRRAHKKYPNADKGTEGQGDGTVADRDNTQRGDTLSMLKKSFQLRYSTDISQQAKRHQTPLVRGGHSTCDHL